jgi:hypothetical protein
MRYNLPSSISIASFKQKAIKVHIKQFARFSPQVLKTKFKSKSGDITHLKSRYQHKEIGRIKMYHNSKDGNYGLDTS